MSRLFALCMLVLFAAPALAQDDLNNIPIPDPRLEMEALQLMDGFEINLFAADPMIEKPIQMTWDEEGRLWVVGSNIYPHLLPGQAPNDKIYVLEDTDDDGQADVTTVFADGLLTPSGIAVGDGGVYVANSTEILHIRDLDGDGYGEDRRVVLRGFGADDTHHIIHSFRWAPDGMLYINQSIYIFSHIETPWGVRRLRQGGIWHYRTETMELDVLSTGFVNPWGHEFDPWGQSFATDGAFHDGINHVFPGSAFVAAYETERILAGLNPGQPKHAGLAIVSGRHMPDSLQGHMIANDFRANRVNRFAVDDLPEGRYRSTQRPDLISTDNVAFRPVDVTIGPDGAIYLADWYNPIIQHGEVDFRDSRRDHIHGRIWRITAKDRPLVDTPRLKGASVAELLDALMLPEEWTRTQARRLLRERGAAEVLPVLQPWIARQERQSTNGQRMLLEGLWLHQALDRVEPTLLREVLAAPDPRARAAAVRVLYHWNDRVDGIDALLEAAVDDDHARVRREAISALGKRGSAEAARTAIRALDRAMDDELDYALWHTLRLLQPHWHDAAIASPAFFGDDRKRAFALMAAHTPEAMRQLVDLYTSRALPVEYAEETLELLARYGSTDDLNQVLEEALAGDTLGENTRAAYLAALEEAEVMPSASPERIVTLLDADVDDDVDDDARASAARLAGKWQLTAARDALLRLITDERTPADLMNAAIGGLARLDDVESRDQLAALTSDQNPLTLRISVAASLAELDAEGFAPQALNLLQALPETAQTTPLFRALFRSGRGRRAFGTAMAGVSIPAPFATAGLEAYRGNRQEDRALLDALEASGGVAPIERMPQDPDVFELQRIEMDVKASGDAARGETIYRQAALACQRCHAIGGGGGLVGPDLSSIGASAPTDYIIGALLKPDAAIKDGYALVQVERKDGTTVSGLLVRQTGDAVLIRDAGGQVIRVPSAQVEEQQILPGSLMPPGLTAPLEREEFVDLVAFLSRLGEPGDYRLATIPTVRGWEAAVAAANGAAAAVAGVGPVAWEPAFSRVDGGLPLADLTELTSAEGSRHSLVRFPFEAQRAGDVVLEISSVAGVTAWLDGQAEAIKGNSLILSVQPGPHTVTLAIDRATFAGDALHIHIDTDRSSANVVLVNPLE
ncbi:MAG: PVC-type heme-binding CxxCH protein [Rhodothermales bacterium]|nr:PVC-type heme-binding CxxCH protein [Rhodothermales bacterium]